MVNIKYKCNFYVKISFKTIKPSPYQVGVFSSNAVIMKQVQI